MPKEFDDIHEGIKRSLSGKTNPRTKKPYTDDDFYAIATETYKKKYGKNPHGKSEEFLFFTDILEIKSEDENYWVCGYASTTGIDAVNDAVTINCLEDMARQLDGREVKVKLGIEHDWVRTGDPRIMPYAKVEEAKVIKTGNEAKLYVKTRLNKHHPMFSNVWNSLKDGFLDAFSIEYLPAIKWKVAAADGKEVRVLDKVDLSGITFTGRPINSAAKITDVFVKAYASMEADKVMDQMLHMEGVPTAAPIQDEKCSVKGEPDEEQLKMGIKVEMEHTTDPKEAEKIARDHLKEVPDYYSKLKKCVETKPQEKSVSESPKEERHTEDIKSESEKMEKVEEKAEAPKPEAKAEVKADPLEELKKQNLELKAKMEELEKKVELKAMIKDAMKELSVEEKAFKPAKETEIKALDEKLKAEKFPETKADTSDFTLKGMLTKAFGKTQ